MWRSSPCGIFVAGASLARWVGAQSGLKVGRLGGRTGGYFESFQELNRKEKAAGSKKNTRRRKCGGLGELGGWVGGWQAKPSKNPHQILPRSPAKSHTLASGEVKRKNLQTP